MLSKTWRNRKGNDDRHLYLGKIFIAWPMFVVGAIRPFISSSFICQCITQHPQVRFSLYPSHIWPMWSPLANLAGPLLILYVWLCPMVNLSSLHLSLPFIFLLFCNILATGPSHRNRSARNPQISNGLIYERGIYRLFTLTIQWHTRSCWEA